jgi:hypothetical protein
MDHSWLFGLALLVVGCGGTTATIGGDDGGVGNDASSGGSDGATGVDSGTSPDSGGACSARVPKQNRPQGGSCPAQRGPGPTVSNTGGNSCTKDADCTAGHNGRCVPLGFGPLVYSCSYDECFVDSDCPGNVPCDCRDSDSSLAPNVCGTGSECRVNADCASSSSCGWCSPTEVPSQFCFGRNTTYVCHTPSDTCIDDADCGMSGSCNLDPMTKHWACVSVCAPPPP